MDIKWIRPKINNIRYKVIAKCKIIYGSELTACIHLNKGQIWEYIAHSPNVPESYSLYRNGVFIDVPLEDFETVFEEV